MIPFDGVVYQIYPRSFRDTTGNGVGDLAGWLVRGRSWRGRERHGEEQRDQRSQDESAAGCRRGAHHAWEDTQTLRSSRR